MKIALRQVALCAALAATGSVLWNLASATAATTFLHHFDVGDAVNNGAGPADFSVGSPTQQIGLPLGPGGTTVAGGRFGNALERGTGGRVEYQTAGNFNVNKGTIEMWIKGPGVVSGGFLGLWGTDTSTGGADVRMYIYNTGAGRTLGAYQLNGGGSFWEIEQPIPTSLLDDTNWHHVAWAFDANAGITATWWDGQLLRNTPDAGTVNPRTTFDNTLFHIGENQAGSATWPGSIDEFRISDSIVYDVNGNFNPPSAPFAVPEPAGLALVGIGLITVFLRRRME